MEEKKKDEEKVIRHTINAEETFTLAKDVFDLRCGIKNIYNNRAVISRRLNILSLSLSLCYTLLYVAYMLFTGLLDKLALHTEIALYCLLGAYGVLFAAMIILSLCGGGKAKNIRKINKTLSFIRILVRMLSLVLTIVALVFTAVGGEYAAKSMAVDVVLIIFTIICLIVQAIPLLCGGLGKLARWLLSPVKMKYRFSSVALEWYELAVSENGGKKNVKRIAQKYYDDVGICLDNKLIPALGKKFVNTIKPSAILAVTEKTPEEDRTLVEGILKNIFAYATECGYVTFDPCRDLHFEGSIDEEEKPVAGKMKTRLFNIGKKIGKSMLDKYIDKTISDTDE